MKGSTYRGAFLFEGFLMGIIGVLALVLCGIYANLGQMIYGILFIISAVIVAIRCFASASTPGFLLSLLAALVYLVAGIWLISTQYAMDALILFLAILFWIQGVLDLLVSLQRFESNNWGLLFIAGIIVIVLAFIIWIQSGIVNSWTISVLVGINYFVYAGAILLTALTAGGNGNGDSDNNGHKEHAEAAKQANNDTV